MSYKKNRGDNFSTMGSGTIYIDIAVIPQANKILFIGNFKSSRVDIIVI